MPPRLCQVGRHKIKHRYILLLLVPTFATEQYPKGLGPTVPEIELEKYNIKAHAKKCFSMIIPEVTEQMKASSNIKSVILCGIETHACITHTTLGREHYLSETFSLFWFQT